MGDALQKEGNYQEALEFYKRGVEATEGRDPDIKIRLLDCRIHPLRQKLALVKERMTQFDRKAPDAAEKARQLKLHFNALNAEIIKHEMELYSYQVEIQPDNANAHFELGYRYLQQGTFDEAIKSLQQARADTRRKWEALCWLGYAFWKKKNYVLADKNLGDALEAAPSNDEEAKKKILYYRGCIAQERGETASALDYFNEIAAIDFGYKDVAQRLDQLNA